MKIKQLALGVCGFCLSQALMAADLFSATGTVVGATTETRVLGFDTAEEVLSAPKFENLSHYFTNYTGTEQANLDINFRGLGMQVQYPTSDDPLLVFAVPSLGISEHFAGADRDASQQQFSDFMKKNGGHILSQIQKKLAEVSANDPIAGNPNSLMSQLPASDFSTGFESYSVGGARSGAQAGGNLVGVGARVTSLNHDGISNTNLTLPFSYTVRSDIDPRRQLIFKLPVSYAKVEKADSYSVGLGVAYRLPMNDNWTLTPAASYGAVGSTDLGSFAQALGASITSTYVFEGRGYDVVVGNMIGYYKTLKLSVNDYSYDPGIQNTVLRNGIMYARPVTIGGRKMSIEYSLIDTRFLGSDLYNQGYDEIGVTLGTNKSAMSSRSFLRAGASYVFSPNTRGFTLNLGYWF
jgi:hypothetical protein